MKRKCPVCGGVKTSKLKTHDVLVCSLCGLGWYTKIPPQPKLSEIYQKKYFNDKKTVGYRQDAKKRFDYLQKYMPKNGKILDFGFGMGQFLTEVKDSGREAYGYDVSCYAAKRAKRKLKIKAYCPPLTKSLFKAKYFDVITLFDVVEHIKDFNKPLELLKYWLKDDGYLVLTTPNLSSWDARLFGEKWDSLQKIPEHIYFFTPRSVSKVLNELGFKSVKVKNWGLVRSINFVLEKNLFGNGMLITFIRQLFNKTGIGQKYIFYPMHNMMVIARKK